jgi:G:T-mismatch repair DNA endonuclease (very short patch repair protein)
MFMKHKWNDIEIKTLKSVYCNTNDINIVNYFSGRTLTSIKVKAKRLKIYRTEEIKKNNKSNATAGEKNGMYGKTSKIKGKTYDEYYGIEKSHSIKKVLSNNKTGKIGLIGEKNGMYGKIPYNKGISPNNDVREKIKKGVVNYWNNLNDYELKKRKDKLREDWIIKRDKYSEIDTLPEKITENLLLKLKIDYKKKLNIGYYNCDYVINNIIIEVQGDYWHGNPKIYNNFDNIQQKNIKRDNRKFKYLSSNGYEIIYLWEYDLKNNIEYCKNIIKLKLDE